MNKQPRLNYPKVAPHVFQAMLGVEKAVIASGLEKPLLELIKLRVSQINGCAFCIDMHSRDAKKAGETDQRLHLLNAWHEAEDIYTPRESAALRWTEALTRLSSGHVTDEDFAAVSAEFSEVEVANLTLAIVAINGWNRFGVSFKMPVGFLG